MKALTRIVWSFLGRRTSVRLVQCTKAKFLYFFYLCVGKVNILEQVTIITSVRSHDYEALR